MNRRPVLSASLLLSLLVSSDGRGEAKRPSPRAGRADVVAGGDRTIAPGIGGTGGVYFLAEPGELTVEIEKRDRNRRGRQRCRPGFRLIVFEYIFVGTAAHIITWRSTTGKARKQNEETFPHTTPRHEFDRALAVRGQCSNVVCLGREQREIPTYPGGGSRNAFLKTHRGFPSKHLFCF